MQAVILYEFVKFKQISIGDVFMNMIYPCVMLRVVECVYVFNIIWRSLWYFFLYSKISSKAMIIQIMAHLQPLEKEQE